MEKRGQVNDLSVKNMWWCDDKIQTFHYSKVFITSKCFRVVCATN